MKRGIYQFGVSDSGNLLNHAKSVDALRRLWLDRSLVDDLGPGDAGDFDNGAWHVACHLTGAGGAMKDAEGRLLWLEISHDARADDYFASVTFEEGAKARRRTLRLDSAEGRAALQGATLLGFVEGNSAGRISARNVNDPPALFNLWRRQDFDQPVDSTADGGKVWEHWCTLRDIRATARIGTAVLTAYVSLVAVLGDRFAPTIARGRRDYGHPVQLRALVEAGFVGRNSALWDTQPIKIPAQAELQLLDAGPAACLEAIKLLDWSSSPKYYMFARKIASWSTAKQVEEDLSQRGR